MNVRNCRKCGKIFNYTSETPICPRCRETLEGKYQQVKEYIREYSGASITEISEECEVEVGQIQQWIREERLEFTKDSPIKVPCENCGKMIGCGRFCESCKATMTDNLSSVLPKPKRPEPPKRKDAESNKMRFL